MKHPNDSAMCMLECVEGQYARNRTSEPKSKETQDMATYVTGDTHGDGIDLAERMRHARMRKGSTIIIAGDAGIAYGSWHGATMLLTAEAKPGIGIIVMRGNHDVRYWWNATRYDDGELRRGWHLTKPDRHGSSLLYNERYPNILYVRDDGGLYDINGTSILFIPGAYSIDQQWRIDNGYPYEEEEQLTASEMERLAAIAEGTDERITVISHTCPQAWEDEVSATFASGIDQASVDKTMERWMNGIWDAVRDKCDGWYFGHYHADMDIEQTNGIARMLYHDVVRIGTPRKRTTAAVNAA